MKNSEKANPKKHIVVVGGGFAGLNFAKKIANNNFYDVTVLDKNNYNYFTPLLYQVATGYLEPSSISYPFRKLFRNKGVKFRLAEVEKVDTDKCLLYLNNGEIAYDYVVFAAGAKTNFFGNEDVKRRALSLKGMDDAISMRNELIRTMEKAAIETDLEERKRLLTIVIVGGGATGVEIAGVLAEMKKFIIEKDYPEFKGAEGDIHVVDGNTSLLAPMSEKTHKAAYSTLRKLGVKVKLLTHVSNYQDDKITFSDGAFVEAKTVIWCAGVTANIVDGIPKSSLGIGNRMKTNQFNQVLGLDNVYAVGDISVQETDPVYPKGHPQLAQPAIQQGGHLAKNLKAMAQGKALTPFKYFDKGDMAIIGRNYAVADLFKHKLHFGGFLGLMSWLFIHIVSLVNYNNKIKTFYDWVVAYLTRDQHLRMIFTETEKKGQRRDMKNDSEGMPV
ncbi:NAD(P)/FAD-dependent oxidoreductase [Olivibacter domesticus]|uniref:NADH:ubiquinone reductase (non-electrogenic) n=1 Tax=Olivibacter domesticus TaxID=407022 RepID=A0A1H7ZCE2_OLID1|nr:NAD(P)/FAD-dependent oxidoreductase [Olivibacter domesticus]SEM55664.1 NADH dehydrogenase [Olivibacter domesticus]